LGAGFGGADTGAREGDALGEDAVEDMLLDDIDRVGVLDAGCPTSDTADDACADVDDFEDVTEADMGPVASLFLRDPIDKVVDVVRDDVGLSSGPLFDTNMSVIADNGDGDDDTASRGDPVSLMADDETLLL
jgi:hypothetical protein